MVEINKYLKLFNSWLRHQKAFIRSQRDSAVIRTELPFDVDELYDKVHLESHPVFVLSTGRCGTELLTRLFELSSATSVHHFLYPEMTYYSGYAYRNQQSHKVLSKIADACRYEYIRDAFIMDRRYIETNSRITFFAPQLAELYPSSKFIHLIRPLVPFVRSGYSRNYYSYERVFDEGRITPLNKKIPFDRFSQLEKIAWLWCETNDFIHRFLSQLSSERKLFVPSNDLFENPETTINIFRFADVPPPSLHSIKKGIRTPVNMQPESKKKALSGHDISGIISFARSFSIPDHFPVA